MQAIIFLSIACLAISSASCFAQEPMTVWRIDTRPPSAIFVNGFLSWGNNNNVRDHISGDSCVERPQHQRDTVFVSVSADRSWIDSVVVDRARVTPGTPVYVYEIRADEHFYNAARSLQHYADEHADEIIPTLSYVPSRESTEYLAHARIQRENIRSSIAFVDYDGSIIELPTENNPRYIALETHASESPYAGQQPAPRSRWTWGHRIPFVGSCYRSSAAEKQQVEQSPDYRLESVL